MTDKPSSALHFVRASRSSEDPARLDSSPSSSIAISSSTGGAALTPSNVGFQLLQKSGWTQGSGLGVAQQGRLEPLDITIKKDKRGLGAKVVRPKTNTVLRKAAENQNVDGNTGKRSRSKKMSKRLKQELAIEKRLQEQSFQREFFMEFWPENV